MAPPAADDGSRTFERVDDPRGDVAREWELFVRESSDDPLRHAGSVTAGTAEIAREQAASLFGWRAEAFWLCPADETARFVAEDGTLAARGGGDAGETADATGGETSENPDIECAEGER